MRAFNRRSGMVIWPLAWWLRVWPYVRDAINALASSTGSSSKGRPYFWKSLGEVMYPTASLLLLTSSRSNSPILIIFVHISLPSIFLHLLREERRVYAVFLAPLKAFLVPLVLTRRAPARLC